MANNPYFNANQRQRVLQGKPANAPTPEAKVQRFEAKLDSEAMSELKDISSNTLETALNTMDIKEGISSFENKFKEKFKEFAVQKEQEDTLSAESADFMGPIRPSNLTDNSSASVDNSVTVTQNNDSLQKIEENTGNTLSALLSFMDVYEKQLDLTPSTPVADPEPEEKLNGDKEEREEKDKNKKQGMFNKSLVSLLKDIKGNTSSILSRFIGYTLEAMAKFAKWTLIIGSIVFAIDVLGVVIKKWFQDILAEGEASKELFGTYLPQVKRIMEKIDDGLKNFNMDDLGGSLGDLFVEPLKALGSTIKTAITEGIGNLIFALGEYTNSDTIKDAGRSMKISALRDKQAAGLDIAPADLLLLKEEGIKDQEVARSKASSKVMTSAPTSNWEDKNSYNQMGQLADKQKQLAELKKVDAAREAAELEKQKLEQMKKELEAMKKDPKLLKDATDAENETNRKRVSAATRKEEDQKNADKASESDIEKAQGYLDKDDITPKDKKEMESLLESLDERKNTSLLNDDDVERFRDIQDLWQNKITAQPENSAAIEPPPKPNVPEPSQQQGSNVMVNNKTVNNTVNNSVQRTEHKPLVQVA